MFVGVSYAQKPMLGDATLKAVFIERFTRFIEWPEHALDAVSPDQFVICFFDGDDFASEVSRVYSRQQILQRNVRVSMVVPGREKDCHVLFLPSSKHAQLEEILSRVNTLPVLTLGDTQGYAHRGVLVNFFYVHDQLRFEINQSAMRNADFEVSYKLLSYAVIVESVTNDAL